MDEENELKSKIFFFYREKYFNCMITSCKDGIQKFRTDPSFNLFYAMALLLNNRLEESINQLEAIKGETHVKLAAIIALMYSHKLLGASNKDLFQKLDGEMRELRKSTDATEFYHSAVVLLFLHKPEKALDYVDKSLNIAPDLPESLRLKTWVLLTLGKPLKPSLIEVLEASLRSHKRNLDGSLALIECYLAQHKLDDALNAANQAIVRSTPLLPLIQKMRVQFAAQSWEHVFETTSRILQENPIDLTVLRLKIIISLAKDTNYDNAVLQITEFQRVIQDIEPKNALLLHESAQIFSRICGRNTQILTETVKLSESAVQIEPGNVNYIVELGTQFLLLNKVKEAQKYFKTASKRDETSLKALMGLTQCEILESGVTEQVKEQIEFLLELEEAQLSAQLYALRARSCDNTDEALLFLKKSCDLQMNAVKNMYYSEGYLRVLDPDFMLQVVREYLRHGAGVDLKRIATPLQVLKVVCRACPGLYEAVFLLSKLQFLAGESANAVNTLEKILAKIDGEQSSDAHLLMAQIQVDCGYFERAAQHLEAGLSQNFNVRNNALYHYIRGLVDKNTGQIQDAVKSLNAALSISSGSSELSVNQRASVQIELIEAHNLMGQSEEAGQLLEGALDEFQKSPELGRLLILNAEHYIKRGNIDGAIELLSKIQPTEACYLAARTKIAEVLLKYRLDKYAYLECYQNMVDENPSAETYLLLADAYMTILEPDDALDCYNLALQQNPNDITLMLKMGKALVETHYFAKAITFYKDSIKSTQNPDLKLQLSDLYMQLKEFEKAELLLMSELEGDFLTEDDVTQLQYKTKLSMLLASTREKSGNLSGALSSLKDARDTQNRVRKRLSVELSNVPEEEIALLVEIGIKLAEISTTLKNSDLAVQFYKDTLENSPQNLQVLTGLAKLYMQMGLLESCQQICSNILGIDSENEQASVMMADIAFRKVDFDMALFHFTQLIAKQPTNWTALVRLVEIMRRSGNLSDFPEHLAEAERNIITPKEPGYLFCTALFQWHSGNLNGALRNFNLARQDIDWGLPALCNMIEICLNPDDEMLGEQMIDSEDIEYRDSRSMALKTADRLLKELKSRLEISGEDPLKFRLLSNFRLLATQDKINIECGLEDFVAIASQNNYKEHIGVILGMASAYTLLKQSQRAKNQLKRVAKAAWNFEDAEYLEKCWLLLADYYIQSTKYEVAGDLLARVVQHNKSCCKAHEYLGFISEKEQRYKDAAASYDLAWKLAGKSNPGIGYKLAYNLMKCKQYADAIDTGQQVLKLNPDYPKIKKEILDKSMNNLRC